MRRSRARGAALAIGFVVAGLVPAAFASSPAAAAVARVEPQPSLGCTQTTPAVIEQTLSFDADGVAGSYDIQEPTTAVPGAPLPVIFDFHAYGESGQLQIGLSGLGSYGQSRRFVTVTPWINGQAISQWLSNVGSVDANWFGSLLAHIEMTSCVDEHRIFVTGYSNGGFMALAVACQFSQQIAAVAPVAGLQVGPHCLPSRSVSLVAFQGTADPLLHYDGTPSKAAEDLPAPDGSGETELQWAKQHGLDLFVRVPAMPEQAATWAQRIGCSTTMTTTRVAFQIAVLSWKCPHHANVEMFRIHGGGHAWPGSQICAGLAPAVGYTTFEISADAEMWRFFESHPL